MSKDIDISSAGDLQPYSQPLAPAPTPDFGGTELDLLHESTTNYNGGGQMVFGQPLPPGVSIQQVTEAYQQLGDIFVGDFLRLRHSVSHSQKAVAWFIAAITNPPAKQKPHPRYSLFEHANDPLFCAFSHYAADNGFSAKFVQDACWWVSEAGRKLAQQAQNPVGNTPAHGSAPNSAEAMLATLSDKDYAAVLKINEQALAYSMQVLQRKWGEYTYLQNIAIAQRYLDSLPAKDQAYFDQFTNVNGVDFVHLRNSAEFIIAMFDAATGAHNIPKDGAGIAAEIAECERCMRENRKQWLADSALQARYRTLLDMRK